MLAPPKNVGGCTLLHMSCKNVFLPLSDVCVGCVEEEEEVEREGDLAFLFLFSPCACFSIAIMTAWEIALRTGLDNGSGSIISRLWVCSRGALPNDTMMLKGSQHEKNNLFKHNATQCNSTNTTLCYQIAMYLSIVHENNALLSKGSPPNLKIHHKTSCVFSFPRAISIYIVSTRYF